MKQITEIKKELDARNIEDYESFCLKYEKDERAGVIRLVKKAKKTFEAYKAECIRVEDMQNFERQFGSFRYLCGVDEVGRGPLAGPVVASAVILPKDKLIPFLNDSKKVSESLREKLYDEIYASAISIGIGSVDNHIIDEVNILNATFIAMKEAISKLKVKPDLILVDGNQPIPDLDIPQRTVIKGDSLSPSIAAASIIAKVTRDRLMIEYSKQYPMYDLSSNKGYGSKRHYEGIAKFGASPIHRMSFLHD